MKILLYMAGASVTILLLTLLIAYICFYIAFYVPRKTEENADDISIPEGEIYEPYRDQMTKWIKETRALPHEDVSITSFDGLKLVGKYYEYAPGAPIELMFHGYRGSAERDLSGGVQRCFSLGRNVLLVDQRTSNQKGNMDFEVPEMPNTMEIYSSAGKLLYQSGQSYG